jgi:hypothetical protein
VGYVIIYFYARGIKAYTFILIGSIALVDDETSYDLAEDGAGAGNLKWGDNDEINGFGNGLITYQNGIHIMTRGQNFVDPKSYQYICILLLFFFWLL